MLSHTVPIVVVFVASALGCVIARLPIITQRKQPSILLKMFSAGVILSLALVHIIPEAEEHMMTLADYPFGHMCALGGLILFMILDHLSHPASTVTCPQDLVELGMHHEHTCITTRPIMNRKTSPSICLFEVACLLHSVFIGIGLGLETDPAAMTKLTIAIVFHQFLEGVSLGYVLSEKTTSVWKYASTSTLYAITAPAGIVFGKLVIANRHTDTTKQDVVAGFFQSTCGGLLMYVALFQIITEELTQNDLHHPEQRLFKYAMYASVLLGATSMCALAIWM